MSSTEIESSGYGLDGSSRLPKDLVERIREYQRKQIDRKLKTSLIKPRNIKTPRVTYRSSNEISYQKNTRFIDSSLVSPASARSCSPGRSSARTTHIPKPPTDPSNFVNIESGNLLPRRGVFKRVHEPYSRDFSFESEVQRFTPSLEDVTRDVQRSKELEIDQWIKSSNATPISILAKVSEVSPVHSSILSLIVSKLAPILYEDSSQQSGEEEETNDFDKEAKELIEKCNPEKFERAGVMQDKAEFQVPEEVVEKVTEFNILSRDLEDKTEELNKEIAILEEELKSSKEAKENAIIENKDYKRLYFKQFGTYDLPAAKEENKEEDTQTLEKKKNDEAHLFTALYGERSHLKSEYRNLERNINEHHKMQLEIAESAALREFKRSNGQLKKK